MLTVGRDWMGKRRRIVGVVEGGQWRTAELGKELPQGVSGSWTPQIDPWSSCEGVTAVRSAWDAPTAWNCLGGVAYRWWVLCSGQGGGARVWGDCRVDGRGRSGSQAV